MILVSKFQNNLSSLRGFIFLYMCRC